MAALAVIPARSGRSAGSRTIRRGHLVLLDVHHRDNAVNGRSQLSVRRDSLAQILLFDRPATSEGHVAAKNQAEPQYQDHNCHNCLFHWPLLHSNFIR